MIRTLNGCRVSARLLAQSRPAVAADIVKSVNLPAPSVHDDETLSCHLLDEIIARPGNLTLVPHANPLCGKDLRLFFREHFRRNKVTLRQRRRAGGKSFSRFAKCSDWIRRCLGWHVGNAPTQSCRRQRLPQESFAAIRQADAPALQSRAGEQSHTISARPDESRASRRDCS